MRLTIKKTQHCTSTECGYSHSHTFWWCGYSQPRRCGCAYCYEEEPTGDNMVEIEVPDTGEVIHD